MHLKNFKYEPTGILFLFALIILGCSKKENTSTEPIETIPNAAYIDLTGIQQVIRGFGGVNMPAG